ncbi:Uncharacterized protein NEOC95_001537 [Neochlamydia sp. AcF95]|nr:Uncharacterized protein [Neochlamydia sp. AcF95]
MMNQFFYPLLTFAISLFFIVLGLLSILVQASQHVRSEFVAFIERDQLFLSLFGIGCLAIGVAIIFYLRTNLKKSYLKINSKDNHAYFLDENIFQEYMHDYWKQLFPKEEVPSSILIKKNKVVITADLPYIPSAKQKALMARINDDVKEMLVRLLGYQQEYVLSLSFQKEIP